MLPLIALILLTLLPLAAQPARPRVEAAPSRETLQARVQANPADLEAHMLLARTYLDGNEPAKALPHLQVVATLRPDAGPLVFQYGVLQLETGDLEGGYQTLTELARREPNEAATRAYLVRATGRLEKPQETREHLAALRTLVPQDALFHAQLVEWTATECDPQVALEQIAYTLRFPLDNKRKARVRYLEGFAQNRLGERAAAMASLKEAIALDDSDPRMIALLLTLEGTGGMRNINTGLLKESLRRFPTSTDLLLLTGLLNIENEEYQAVKEIAGRLDIVAPGRPEAMLLKGHVALAMNEFDAAAGMFQQALSSGMATPHLLHQLGLAEQKAGRTDEAREAYGKALELDGTDADLLFDYAQLLSNLGSADKARPLAERMLALQPESLRANKLMADLERKLGNREAAAKHLAAFKRLSIAAQATRRQPNDSDSKATKPSAPAP